MPGQIYKPTPSEIQIFKESESDPNLFLDYWLRKKNMSHGWMFDYNFTEDQKWQEAMCMASQSFIVTIAGIATGKTLGVVVAAGYHGAMTPNFRFLNVARDGWQSKLMHKAFTDQVKDTPFEKLIVSTATRPYPIIRIGYMLGDYMHEATLEFMSLGEKGDATNIMSYRGDWINIDEAGLIDNLNEIVGNLATRLTGVSAEGRPLLARMSLTSNPWDNIELWQLYDMAAADKDDGLVFNIDTAANKNVTEKQIKLALKRIPEENHVKFMTGRRPQGSGGFFSGNAVEACESEILGETIKKSVKEGVKDYIYNHNPVLGVWYFRVPRQEGHTYVLYGDPGIGAAPARNAPTIVVFDVTHAGKRFIPVVGMWWGNGGGSILPFQSKLLEFISYYKPLEVGIDSTGTQKNMAELINYDHIRNKNYSIDYILPLSFASNARYTYLHALRMTIEAGIFKWPKFLYKNLSSQLKNYDDIKDRSPNTKLAQDIVACLAMGAFRVRSLSLYYDEEESEQEGEAGTHDDRSKRVVDRARTAGRDRRRSPSLPVHRSR